MVTEIFKSIVVASCMGGMLTALLLALKPLTRRMLGAKWQFYLWLSVLMVFVCPVRFQNSVALPETVYRSINVLKVSEVPSISVFEDSTGVYMREAVDEKAGIVDVAAVVWMVVVFALLAKTVVGYLMFKRKLNSNSCLCEGAEGIVIRECGVVGAPLVFGFMKPVLYLPKGMRQSANMEYIIAHERVHIARKDVWVKCFSVLVRSIHWFNPMAYLVLKQLNRDCEIACDAEASRGLSMEDRGKYMQTVLEVSENETGFKKALSAGLTAEGRCLKERLYAVQNTKRVNAVAHIAGAVMLCVFTIGTITAVGMVNGSFTEDTKTETVEYKKIADKAEETNGVHSVASADAPLSEETKSANDIIVSVSTVEEQHQIPTDQEQQKTPHTVNSVEPEQKDMPQSVEKHTEPEVEEKTVIQGEFNSDEGDTKHIYGAVADENGCITVGIRSNTQETVDVYISDSTSGRTVQSMGVPVPYEAEYVMEGLEPGKEYDIMLKGEMRNDWNIESEYMIY